MSKTKWFKGPPPSIGWWPASRLRLSDTLRWWNGKKWSLPAYEKYTAKEAGKRARLPSFCGTDIEWTNRPASWPERSKT
jgi:hypothetical protein